MRTYVFDIDGTICTVVRDGNYENAQPLSEKIKIVNRLYDKGYKIIFYTARGMGRHSNDKNRAHDQFYDMTHEQLISWNVKFHELFLGKPAGDLYIDDKGIKAENFFVD